MKKLLSVVLVMGMVLSLAACGSKSSDLKFGQVEYAAHGTKSFAVTTVVMDGDKIAIAYIDEFQVMAKADTVGVPNSDSDFGAAFADPETQLASKRVNNEYYSNNMATKAGSTVKLADSYDAIQKYAVGKTIAELEKAIEGKESADMVDAVSGATLADTLGYIQSIIEAAKAAK
jgi:major membrane immunogen (membrane-anchored lipoprotein)